MLICCTLRPEKITDKVIGVLEMGRSYTYGDGWEGTFEDSWNTPEAYGPVAKFEFTMNSCPICGADPYSTGHFINKGDKLSFGEWIPAERFQSQARILEPERVRPEPQSTISSYQDFPERSRKEGVKGKGYRHRKHQPYGAERRIGKEIARAHKAGTPYENITPKDIANTINEDFIQ